MNTILYLMFIMCINIAFLFFAYLLSYIPYLLIDMTKGEAFIGTLLALLIVIVYLLYKVTGGEI